MNGEPEELQFLGVIGVFGEAYKIVLSRRRIFSRIVLAFILPLSLLSLFPIYISAVLFAKILVNERALDVTPDGGPAEDRNFSRLGAEWSYFLLFEGVYLIVGVIFALLSTAAVVYTVACVYTSKDITFPEILSVVPKVWRRLMITFLCTFLLLVAYNILLALVIVPLLVLLGAGVAGAVAVALVVIAYMVGLVYVSIVWYLASVVSVLEDSCGIAAMQKSRMLIKGKLGMVIGIILLLNACFMVIYIAFRKLVVDGGAIGPRIVYGVLALSLLCLVQLFGLVIQTVVYFVCKSYHHESIEKSSLADHLEVYLGEYAPLKGRDAQVEQYTV